MSDKSMVELEFALVYTQSYSDRARECLSLVTLDVIDGLQLVNKQ